MTSGSLTEFSTAYDFSTTEIISVFVVAAVVVV
jgi:hypothetical protein